jgi:hypothetical protein
VALIGRIDKKGEANPGPEHRSKTDMKLNSVIEKLVSEFGSDEDQAKTTRITSIICKAFKNADVPDEKGEKLIRVGRQLRAMGLK